MRESAIDWLFKTFHGTISTSVAEEPIVKTMVKMMCPIDRELDSPVPRWVLNILMCTPLGLKNRIRLVLKHHEKITGQEICHNIMKENK